jgi:benzoyl-CoA reductase/2-hydroxyglutaryl-CoA dehydratase subunit BcrC/BadD/HgdB
MTSSADVGITTTLPVEVVLAAGRRPIDLNNRFITSGRAGERVRLAEQHGFPRTVCSWVKGLYGTVLEEGFRTVIGVTQGDCSLTHALLEVLQTEGVEVIRFEYPYDRDPAVLDDRIRRLEEAFGVTRADTERVRDSVAPLRADLAAIDAAMGRRLGASLAARAHLAILSGSDFGGDLASFGPRCRALRAELDSAGECPRPARSRLALAGVPPIVDDLYVRVERLGARIVLSEMAREFAMVRPGCGSLVEQYARYAYPYDVFYRLAELSARCGERHVDGVLHYVQSFCFRGVQDRIVKERLGVPVLTLECDRPGSLDEGTVTRLEAFIEMLDERRAATQPGRRTPEKAGQ